MKSTLVPSACFDPSLAVELLSDVVTVNPQDAVKYVMVKEFGAVLLYTECPGKPSALPVMYYLLEDMKKCTEYNRILASYDDGYLSLAIAQGPRLLLCNTYEAVDFTTAEYFIFLAMKRLQLNPEVSTISFRTSLTEEQEMSLYNYFKSVEVI